MPKYTVTDMPAPFIAGKPTPGPGKVIELSARDAAYEVRRGLLVAVRIETLPPPLFVVPPLNPVPFSKRRSK